MGGGGAGAAGASTGAVTSSTRLLVLLNPHAGRGAAAEAWVAAEPILRAAGCTSQLVETKRPGHARELLAALPRGAFDAVVVAGGDGSLHEAINGLMAADTPRPPLGLIPAGTGNSLAADLECLDPHQAARAIADGRTRPLDVMKVRLGPPGDRAAGAAAASVAPALPCARCTLSTSWAPAAHGGAADNVIAENARDEQRKSSNTTIWSRTSWFSTTSSRSAERSTGYRQTV
jgi:Diacylglycerol kinase catalytic domain